MIECKYECVLTPENGNKCCCFCENKECERRCTDTYVDCEYAVTVNNTDMEKFQSEQMTVIEKIKSVVRMKKECEEQEKTLKDALKKAMENYSVKKFESEDISISYVPESTVSQIDSAKIKMSYPDIAAECQKSVKRSSYVKITVKGGE